MDSRAIGVFDSGFGGLTVLNEIMNLLPNENIVYFGDNGRAPYGTKSPETVIKFTLQNIRFLLTQNIKVVVIACNTASAVSLEVVKNTFDIPIIEVVMPGSIAAVNTSISKKVGVIGTVATINSDVYKKAISSLDGDIQVFSKACPMFVPLVEEGWWNNEISYMISKEYLAEMNKFGIDTLVMGCTHYPLLQDTIHKVMGEGVKLVSSAQEVAKAVKRVLTQTNMLNVTNSNQPKFFTSDNVLKFKELGSSIVGKELQNVEKVEIENY